MEYRLIPIERAPAGLDFQQLVAALATRAAVSRTGLLASALRAPGRRWTRIDALVTVACGSAGWPDAARALGSCFHRDVAGQVAARARQG